MFLLQIMGKVFLLALPFVICLVKFLTDFKDLSVQSDIIFFSFCHLWLAPFRFCKFSKSKRAAPGYHTSWKTTSDTLREPLLCQTKKAVYDEINKHFGICLFTCFFHISYTAFWAVLFISLLMFTGICCIFLHFSSVGYCVYPKVYGFLFFLPIFVKNFIVTCNFLFSGKKTDAKICLISTPADFPYYFPIL